MTTANIYLTFNGNCEEAFNFYKGVFGGEFDTINRFNEMPPNPEKPINEEEGNRIMHVSLTLDSGSLLMGSDTGAEWAADFKAGNNFSISLGPDSKEEADKLYAGLSEGGIPAMPMADQFWGAYFGMLTDKFGIAWMINVNAPK